MIEVLGSVAVLTMIVMCFSVLKALYLIYCELLICRLDREWRIRLSRWKAKLTITDSMSLEWIRLKRKIKRGRKEYWKAIGYKPEKQKKRRGLHEQKTEIVKRPKQESPSSIFHFGDK